MFSISKAVWSILHLISPLQCFSFRWRYMTSLGHNKLNVCFWATHTDETTYKTHTSDKMITTLVCVQRHPKIVPNQHLHYMFLWPTFSQWTQKSIYMASVKWLPSTNTSLWRIVMTYCQDAMMCSHFGANCKPLSNARLNFPRHILILFYRIYVQYNYFEPCWNKA